MGLFLINKGEVKNTTGNLYKKRGMRDEEKKSPRISEATKTSQWF
jgi:hypothetical protein